MSKTSFNHNGNVLGAGIAREQMNKQDKKEIDSFVRQVVKKYKSKIQAVILFGSASRNQLNKESDIDFLIVASGNRLDFLKKITRIAASLVLKYGRPISTKVYGISQYAYLKGLETPFMKNIENEGKILWMRS